MPPTVRDIDILALGGIDADLVLKVPFIPSHDEKVKTEFVGWFSGGPVGNMACAASRLELRVHAMCQVGQDEGGTRILDDYRAVGVDTSLCDIRQGETSPFTVILIDPTGEKVILLVSHFTPTYDLEKLGQALERTRILFMLPHAKEFVSLATLARERGALVMTDIEPDSHDDRAHLKEVLQVTDIASFNQFGVRTWAGQEPTPELAQELTTWGPSIVLFTLGARGAIGATRERALYCEGHEVHPVADTTGAGDTFHGAFAAAHLGGAELTEALVFANAAGALSVTALGPRGYLPTHDDVQRFLQDPH